MISDTPTCSASLAQLRSQSVVPVLLDSKALDVASSQSWQTATQLKGVCATPF
jgi:hypothetical protein